MDTADKIAKSLDRIGKILAGILLKDIEEGQQRQKIARLKQCGFDNSEIAKMLNTTPNSINVSVHSLRNHRKRQRNKA